MEIRAWRHFDVLMLLTTLALGGYGLAMIYSATLDVSVVGIGSLVLRQAIYLAVGFGLLLILAATDYRWVGSLSWLFYGGCILLLIVVQVIGSRSTGRSARSHWESSTCSPPSR